MGILTRLFGQTGIVRFEAELEDGKGTFTGKIKIETIGNTKEEIEHHLANLLWVEKGIRVYRLRIIGFHET